MNTIQTIMLALAIAAIISIVIFKWGESMLNLDKEDETISEKEDKSIFNETEEVSDSQPTSNTSEYPIELKEWIKYVKAKKLSYDDLFAIIADSETCNFNGVFLHLRGGHGTANKAKFLFDQWNKPKVVPKKDKIDTKPAVTRKPSTPKKTE